MKSVIVPAESIETTGGRRLEDAEAFRERIRERRGERVETMRDSSSTVQERVETEDGYCRLFSLVTSSYT